MDLDHLPSGLKTTLVDDGGLELRIYYLECMAQATYLVTHEGKAFIVDPRRDVDAFLEDVKSSQCSLAGILETHFHADFVSGHYELNQRTGATIYFGPTAAARALFPLQEVKDGDTIEFSSRYAFKVLHTPGHTPESVVYLLVDKTNGNKPLKAFTGDTLFIGSCGRPDLVGSVGYSAEDMSKLMFATLRDKILTLPDDVQVFPAHGAGSPCGKNLSADLFSTIGKERLTNSALQYTDENEFVKFLTEGQPVAPGYFGFDVLQNLTGAKPVSEEITKVQKVNAQEFRELADSGSYTIIDTRNASDFVDCHIAGSLNFPLGGAGGTIVGPEDGNFAIWFGTLVSSSDELLMVTLLGKERETLQRLSRIGYNKVKALLDGGIEAYKAAGYSVSSARRVNLQTGPGLDSYLSSGKVMLDVRSEGEFAGNTMKQAINFPLANINSLKSTLDKDKEYIVFCVAGYRSTIASSILRKEGYHVQDVYGGFAAISVFSHQHTTSGAVCPGMKAVIAAMMMEK